MRKTVRWMGAIIGLYVWMASAAPLAAQGTPATQSSEKVTTVHETVTTIREVQTTVAQPEAKTRTVAIFLKNRSGCDLTENLLAFEDMVVSQITDLGFRVISPEDTLRAVSSLDGEGRNPGDSPLTELDQLLEESTSATRLAQNLGADYVLAVSISGIDKQTADYQGKGIQTQIEQTTLRATYKILDATQGASLTAGMVEAVNKRRQGGGLIATGDPMSSLLADAAKQIAQLMVKRGGTNAVDAPVAESNMASFSIACGMADMAIPEVVRDEQGEYVLTANRYQLQAMSVTVELDGAVLGSSPGKFTAPKGLHKIRLTREGFKPWERTIFVREGMMLNVALELTDEGRVKWQDQTAFLTGLKTNQRLTDAHIEQLEGMAQMLRQSGYRIDHRSNENININQDVKIDTTEAPTVNIKKQSFWAD